MSVGFVKPILTVHARLVNTLGMTASCVVSGKCGHSFHLHCIIEWIKQESSKGQCPLCRQKFEWTENKPVGA
ncbi:BgTH12-07364 [Blumeria graminis f. sp. triticale]|uniref:BgTH12-07364 n=1 Tax=Blumeria graminis f. sp. triticale TaxID=1689686 RepID=A0A9W4GJ11_BLUGR|nr:BgTH12-07364 [Blumeria graminis f. sp. triticale]